MTQRVLLIVALVVAIILASSVYVVNEWEQVIITQFGKPTGAPVTVPGLKFKIPFIQDVNRIENRFLEWQGKVAELPTRDKVFILVDTYARWQISDPLQYLETLKSESVAQSRLDDIIDGETRNAIARHELIEVIRISNRTPEEDADAAADLQSELSEIETGREEIRQEILDAARRRTSDLGIEVLDVQFRRINYSEQVLRDVYSRMISERKRISDRFRSQGQGQKAEILGNMERELKRIQSLAFKEAEEIRGDADAEATDIYAGAYNRSTDTRRFYEFLKTMEILEQTVDADTTLLLSTDSEFYRYLKGDGR